MLNRRHIRIKVMQTLYAFDENDTDLKKHQRFLNKSMNDMYELHLGLLSLLIEIHKKAEDHLEKSQKKFLATDEDRNPNFKFLNNSVLRALRENEELENILEKRKVKIWYLDFEYVDIVFKEILNSPYYKEYLNSEGSGLKSDKEFLIDIYTNIIASNEQLYDFLEDKKITWVDDFPVVNTNLLKLIKKFKSHSSERHFLAPLYKDEEDREFGKMLLDKVILNKYQYHEEISDKTTNWDSDRIAMIDMVLLHMALCEFQSFSSIPYKVTINEYLEISKEYSTPKSSIFINGILDKIVKEYQSNGDHQKVGRGLL